LLGLVFVVLAVFRSVMLGLVVCGLGFGARYFGIGYLFP